MADANAATELVAGCSGNDVTTNISRVRHQLNVREITNEKLMDTEEGNQIISSSTNSVEKVDGLVWKNGIGILPGTDMKFRVNEFGDVIMIFNDQNEIEDKVDDSRNEAQHASTPNTVSFVMNTEASHHRQDSHSRKEVQDAEVTSRGLDVIMKDADTNDINVGFDDSTVQSKQEDNNIFVKGAFPLYSRNQSTSKKLTGKIISCAFCQISGDSSLFMGRFCSKQCVGKNAGRHKRKLSKPSPLSGPRDKRNTFSPNTLSVEKIAKSVEKETTKRFRSLIRRNTSIEAVDTDYDLFSKRRNSIAVMSERPRKFFPWQSYLKHENAIAAPTEIFLKMTNQNPIPDKSNMFKVGWFLEAVDPSHQSMIAFVSVASIIGHRLRLHFEGYPSIYDFWVNSDSPLIFPCGFCEKTGRSLSPPCGYEESKFEWRKYVEEYSLSVAPDEAFSRLTFANKTGFNIFDRLEAIDRHHPELTCVASINDAIGNNVLVHFDGWNSCYDYWTLHSSNYIHPVGWCARSGKELTPPLGFNESGKFNWKTYLDSNQYKAADSSLFSQDSHRFEVGMKLEAVDPRNPLLVRVGSVAATDDYRVKVHFDGWNDAYDHWFDADSKDLHPINWCHQTQEALQAPTGYGNLDRNEETFCPVKGCLGIGHIKGDKFQSHHSEFGCPYSKQNLRRDPLPDRLTYDKTSSHHDVMVDGNNNTEENATVIVRKRRGRPRLYNQISEHERKTSQETLKHGGLNFDHRHSRRRRHSSSKFPPNRNTNRDPVFQSTNLRSMPEQQEFASSSAGWEKHMLSLPGIKGKTASEVTKWSAEEVSSFVNRLTNKNDCGDVFVSQEVDGEAFLLLTQSDMTSVLNLKLGPSVKIFNAIAKIKSTAL